MNDGTILKQRGEMDLAKIEQKKQSVIFRVRGEKQSSRGLMRLGQC